MEPVVIDEELESINATPHFFNTRSFKGGKNKNPNPVPLRIAPVTSSSILVDDYNEGIYQSRANIIKMQQRLQLNNMPHPIRDLDYSPFRSEHLTSQKKKLLQN
jgi:hypothetical protein